MIFQCHIESFYAILFSYAFHFFRRGQLFMSQKSILVVEDEVDISQLIKRSLSLKQFDILVAHSGTEALGIIEKTKPDLILLDIMMPDMDGFEVCRQIKANSNSKDIPVVFLTVRSNQEDMIKGKDAGAIGYITKPFDPFKLSEEVEKLLQSDR